ncbi:hypothetical protein ABW21_db0206631 [Orbilia brochopaga]|nr:hypothetical protein ABW21_db0206631 [Drechslerella brochopaga]
MVLHRSKSENSRPGSNDDVRERKVESSAISPADPIGKESATAAAGTRKFENVDGVDFRRHQTNPTPLATESAVLSGRLFENSSAGGKRQEQGALSRRSSKASESTMSSQTTASSAGSETKRKSFFSKLFQGSVSTSEEPARKVYPASPPPYGSSRKPTEDAPKSHGGPPAASPPKRHEPSPPRKPISTGRRYEESPPRKPVASRRSEQSPPRKQGLSTRRSEPSPPRKTSSISHPRGYRDQSPSREASTAKRAESPNGRPPPPRKYGTHPQPAVPHKDPISNQSAPYLEQYDPFQYNGQQLPVVQEPPLYLQRSSFHIKDFKKCMEQKDYWEAADHADVLGRLVATKYGEGVTPDKPDETYQFWLLAKAQTLIIQNALDQSIQLLQSHEKVMERADGTWPFMIRLEFYLTLSVAYARGNDLRLARTTAERVLQLTMPTDEELRQGGQMQQSSSIEAKIDLAYFLISEILMLDEKPAEAKFYQSQIAGTNKEPGPNYLHEWAAACLAPDGY